MHWAPWNSPRIGLYCSFWKQKHFGYPFRLSQSDDLLLDHLAFYHFIILRDLGLDQYSQKWTVCMCFVDSLTLCWASINFHRWLHLMVFNLENNLMRSGAVSLVIIWYFDLVKAINVVPDFGVFHVFLQSHFALALSVDLYWTALVTSLPAMHFADSLSKSFWVLSFFSHFHFCGTTAHCPCLNPWISCISAIFLLCFVVWIFFSTVQNVV